MIKRRVRPASRVRQRIDQETESEREARLADMSTRSRQRIDQETRDKLGIQLCDVMMTCGHYLGHVYIVAPVTASQIVSTGHHIIDQTFLVCIVKLPEYETRYEQKSPAKDTPGY